MNSEERVLAKAQRTQRTQSYYSKSLHDLCVSASWREKFVILFLFLILGNIPLFAQEEEQTQEQTRESVPSSGFFAPPPAKGEFWFCPSAEIGLYSKFSFSYGAGFSIAYGRKVSVGLRAAFLYDNHDSLDVLELNILLRLYLSGKSANFGPFLQFTGGPAIFYPSDGEISLPGEFGLFSAGVSFGWRFLFGNIFFIEPSVRGGYPFIAGGSLALGLRF
ncbi:MAG: hypothetical protein FWC01_04955 [Treponema sp.]|nr:hypothetical protein [Treponema sp.]MCL2237408.1 hypothetical protein [Treponema sp.]